MRRILIAECKEKVSTFNPHLSQYADFRFRYGQDLLNYHRSVRHMLEYAFRIEFKLSPLFAESRPA